MTELQTKILEYLLSIKPKAADINPLRRNTGASVVELRAALDGMKGIVVRSSLGWAVRKDYTPPTPKPKDQVDTSKLKTQTTIVTPVLRDSAMPYKQRSGKPEHLFEYCVRKAVLKNLWRETMQHNQWANALFDKESAYHYKESFMSTVKREYSIYFTKGSTKYGLDFPKIIADFPQWFEGTDVYEFDDELLQLHHDVTFALRKEMREVDDESNKQNYKVASLEEVPNKKSAQHIYIATLDVPDGEEPRLREGVQVELKVGKFLHKCEVVEFDMESAELILTSVSKIPTNYSYMQLLVDASFILSRLFLRWNGLAGSRLDPSLPIYKFIMGETEDIVDVPYTKDSKEDSYSLDPTQLNAYRAALGKDITFIWGPPGTGKSFTLAAIIQSLYKQSNERTVVCCVSNVAVDQLVNKVVDILEKEGEHIPAGNYYRAGHTTDERIIATDFLFPNDDVTSRLRSDIKHIQDELARYKKWVGKPSAREKEQIVQLKAELKDLRESLKDHTDHLVQSSKVVFTTISNFVVSEKLSAGKFDNLIVDEASMLAMPNLIAIAAKITKRIILVGDFQQLSPIALVPDKFLRTNVFALCGITMEDRDHPALHQLLMQRRSHKDIVKIINERFYAQKLRAHVEQTDACVDDGPYPGRVVTVKNVVDGEVRYTRGGTRQNKKSAEAIIEMLDEYSHCKDRKYSIGIISPYKGQVSLIRALMMTRGYSEDFLHRIKVGTVHTFQGSECDIIICDFVDSRNSTKKTGGAIGKIYGGSEGEQLLNVAVSRPRHKLIGVGDIDFLSNPVGNIMSNTTARVFQTLSYYKRN